MLGPVSGLRACPLVLLGLGLACGPSGAVVDSGGSSESTGATATTTSTTSSSTTVSTTNTTTGTTGTTSGSSTDTSGSSETGMAFIDNPDGGNNCLVCDTWAQDCPGGEKCVPWERGCGAACVAVVRDAAAPGEPCSVLNPLSPDDDCDETSVCWDVDPDTGEGTCRALCTGTELDHECAAGTACLLAERFFNVCVPACNPLSPRCPAGQACFGVSDGFACVDEATELVIGNCVANGSCPPSFVCRHASELADCQQNSCCTPVCNLDDPDASADCPGFDAGDLCTPYYDDGQAPTGQQNVGLCALP
jgi:hypothetical protein